MSELKLATLFSHLTDKKNCLLALAISFLFFGPSVWFRVFAPIKNEIWIDANISAGSELSVFLNRSPYRVWTLPIQKKQRATYKIVDLPQTLSHLRIDATREPHSTVQIFSIKLMHGQDLVQDIPGDQLLGWDTANIENLIADSKTKSISYSTKTNDPNLMGEISFVPSSFEKLKTFFGNSSSEMHLHLFSGLMILLILYGLLRFARHWAWLMGIVLFFASLETLSKLTIRMISKLAILDSSKVSVGASLYFGISKSAESAQFILTCALILLAGLLIGYMVRKMVELAPMAKEDGVNQISYRVLIASLALYFFIFFPDLNAVLIRLQEGAHATDWDSQNFYLWNYLIHMGAQVFKDFWFPYGGAWDELAPTPYSVFMAHLHKTFVFGVFSFLTLHLSRKKHLSSVLILFGTWMFMTLGEFRGVERYFMSLNLVLAALAVQPFLRNADKNSMIHFALLGGLLGWTFNYESAQFLYALPAMLFILAMPLVDAFSAKQPYKQILKHTLVASAATGLVIVGKLLGLASSGQLEGFWWQTLNMGSMTASCSVPGDLLQWAAPTAKKENLVFLAPLISLGLGGIFFNFRQNKKMQRLSQICVIMGLLIAMIFLKHLIRPHMANQFLAVAMVGLFLLMSELLESSKLEKYFGAGTLACFLGLANVNGILFQIPSMILNGPQNAMAALDMAINKQQEQKLAYDLYFSADKLKERSESASKVYDHFKKTTLEGDSNLYVLGDDAFLYIMTGQKIPYNVSFYDGSSVKSQQRNLQWLNDNKPKYVLFNPDFTSFDGVPNVVRVPLLYKYVFENYKFETMLGKYHLLVRKEGLESNASQADWDYFYKSFIGEVDFGSALNRIGAPGLQDCAAESMCITYLEVDATDLPKRQSIEVLQKALNREFKIKFQLLPGVKRVYIPLSRLWWMNDEILAKLQESDFSAAGMNLNLKMVRKKDDGSTLY